ncbi:MAG: trypsin-like peptidase domain-containing protein [Betaproteobacteria bacterium]|nr:trypsin-like peptidase domain-containing protein [Betaproteobacteria bacterium]
MRRLWLIFTQAVTISVAVLFAVGTLKPEWMPRNGAPAQPTVTIVEATTVPASASPASKPSGVSYAEAAQRALPAVVHVYTRQTAKVPNHPLMKDPIFRHFFSTPERIGLGSGVIIDPQGFVLTNNHVIENADEIETVLNDGRKFEARLIGRDPETDLAVLKLANASSLPAIAFAPADSLAVGDVVLAIGNPFGIGQTVTMGIASALGRSHLGINTFENYIQTDAAINPGNSGGALIDGAGRLVGINTAIYSRANGTRNIDSPSAGGLGIGFAIPVSIARKVLEQIITHGEVVRGWIGIEMREITPELAETFNLPSAHGVLIYSVLEGSPADQSGVQPGDVLVAIDGQEVKIPRAMLDLVASLPPGRISTFRLLRKNKKIDLKIPVGRRPTPLAIRAYPLPGSPGSTGATALPGPVAG